MIDTHCHLTYPRLHDRIGEVIAMGLPSMASFLMITIYDLVDIFWLANILHRNHYINIFFLFIR